MIKSSLIIPLPPSATAEDAKGITKRAIGLYPCINDGTCTEYALVKINGFGNPQAFCSAKEITINGCKRHVDGIGEDIPPQTFETYQERLKTVTEIWPMSETYQQYLAREWDTFNQQTGGEVEPTSCIE